MNLRGIVLFAMSVGGSLSAQADISDSVRRDKAVVLYEFKETSGDIIDTAHPKYGAPLNLRPYFSGVVRTPGALKISEPNVITSLAAADKITNQCKSTRGLTIEVWLQNAESVEVRSGSDAKKRPQPLRIVSLSKGLLNRNFLLGQFYDAGNMYQIAVNTSGNENDSDRLGGSLVEPVRSKTSAIRVGEEDELQKVVFSVGAEGVGRLYLSDRNGQMYLSETVATGLGGTFNTWRSGAFLSLGNEYMSKAEATSRFSQNDNFASCRTAECLENPNRFWKGSLYLVAIYCEALTPEQIFGLQSFQQITNPVFDVDVNLSITPSLKRAQSIYQRITSSKTPVTNPILKEMEQLILSGDAVGAAALASQEPSFYNITVKDFAARMSNRDETINVPLNDFTATIIGAVRDDISAQKLLSEDMVYVANPQKAAVPSDVVDDMLRSNNHYEALSNGRYDLSKVLVRTTQKVFDGKGAVNNPTPAGLLTTRQWLAAHAVAGTNRRLVEFSLRQFLCTPLEKAADSMGPDDVVARDIDRYPGGVHSKYTSNCRSCHTIMDGLRPAFAHFTYSNSFVKHSYVVPVAAMDEDEDQSLGMKQQPRYIASKLNHNETVYPEGRITTDDRWVNNANRGLNATHFGWTRNSGKGIKDFGLLLAESKAFPRCMAERVFRSVCKREVASSDQAMINEVATEFEKNRQYNLKYLFQKIVTTTECLGGENGQ
ncbi:MAG: DUF1585 domain-containing protein [Bdellovibrio sp.]